MNIPKTFRPEARPSTEVDELSGAPLRLTGRWVKLGYWAVVGTAFIALLFTIFFEVDEVASGPSVVRIEGATSVTAPRAGLVAAVSVLRGARVHRGDVLVRLQAEQDEAELARVQAEHDIELARTLRDANDEGARSRLVSLVAEVARARTRVEQSLVKAPHDGVVGDLRIRPGQALVAGAPLVNIETSSTKATLVTFLPGHVHPRLKSGSRIRLELAGYRFAYQELALRNVHEHLVGPEEAKRFLGTELADTVPMDGPLVITTADMPPDFVVDGERFRYADGMGGVARVSVRRERLILALVPAIRALGGR
jgi:membrane fusion protein, multidrug efflux system